MKPIEYLSPYLPFELKMQYTDGTVGTLTRISNYEWESHPLRLGIDTQELEYEWMFKPILRPLSDLTKEIEHNGEMFVPAKSSDISILRLTEQDIKHLKDGAYSLNTLEYGLVQKLISWHFDVFGLIEQGKAIDINTIPM